MVKRWANKVAALVWAFVIVVGVAKHTYKEDLNMKGKRNSLL